MLIYVGNLSYKITRDDLNRVFVDYEISQKLDP